MDTTSAAQSSSSSSSSEEPAIVQLPRITIKYCTLCKWMLRAGYFAQELLSTFSTTLGEVALIPSTGGVFTVDISYIAPASSSSRNTGDQQQQPTKTQTARLWDRKTQGGFPETKTLKKLVRDIIDPSRDLGHVDGKKSTTTITAPAQAGLDRREDAGNGEHGVTGHDADTGETGEVGEEKHRKEEDKGDAKRQEGGKVEGQGKAACEDCGWIGGIIPDTFSL